MVSDYRFNIEYSEFAKPFKPNLRIGQEISIKEPFMRRKKYESRALIIGMEYASEEFEDSYGGRWWRYKLLVTRTNHPEKGLNIPYLVTLEEGPNGVRYLIH